MTTFLIDLTARLRGRHPAGRRLVPGVVERVGRAEFETGVVIDKPAPVVDADTAFSSNEVAGVTRDPNVVPFVRPRRRGYPTCGKCFVEEATGRYRGEPRCGYCMPWGAGA